MRNILKCFCITSSGECVTRDIPLKKWNKQVAFDLCKNKLKEENFNSITAFWIWKFPFSKRYGLTTVSKSLYINNCGAMW